KDFFPEGTSDLAVQTVTDLNAPEAIDAAKALRPDVICLFGTSILKAPWLEAFPRRIVNLHLGLSPFYRGSATLFWPFYFQELDCLGATIHLAVQKVDAGEIVRRIKATLEPGDNYYAATTRLIRDSIDAYPQTVQEYLEGNCTTFPQENIRGRLLKKSDFNESTLQAALDFVSSGLTEKQIHQATESKRCPCSQ